MPYKDPKVRKEKHKSYAAAHYQRNKDYYKAKQRQHKARQRQLWLDFKETQSCLHCGISHPAIMDFHHVVKDPTNKSVNELTRNGRYKAAMKEVEKCIPLCANCHRLFHWRNTYPEEVLDNPVQPE